MRTSLADGTTFTLGTPRYYDGDRQQAAYDLYRLIQVHYLKSKETNPRRTLSFDIKVRDATVLEGDETLCGDDCVALYRIEVSYDAFNRVRARVSMESLVR